MDTIIIIIVYLFCTKCTDDGFFEVQSGFMEKYYGEFEDSEENKFSYTDIFKEYVSKLNHSSLCSCKSNSIPLWLCQLHPLREKTFAILLRKLLWIARSYRLLSTDPLKLRGKLSLIGTKQRKFTLLIVSCIRYIS